MASKYGSEGGVEIPDDAYDFNKLIGISPGSTSQYRNAESPSNREIQKMVDPDSGGLGDLIKGIFTDKKTGNLDMRTIGALGGALAGGLGALSPNIQKSGYQGGIPRYTANRDMIKAPPAGSRPGAGGVSYGGDVNYVVSGKPTGAVSSGGGGGSSTLGNIAKVAGGAGLAALLGNYLSKPGNASNAIGSISNIFKGIGGSAPPGSTAGGTLERMPKLDEFAGIDDQIRANLESQLPNQLSEEEIQAEFDRLREEYPVEETDYEYAKGGSVPRYLQGETDGMADKIPARIGRDQPAALSHGEFVVPADVVSHLGNGNSDAGAKKLYSMMDKIRQARTGTKKQGKKINPDKFMPGGLANAYADGGSVKRFNAGGTSGVGSAAAAGVTGQEQAPATWAGEYITDMLGKGRALAEAPYQQYGGPLTAGASGLQQQAFQAAGNLSVPGSVGQAAQTAGDIAAKAQGTSYAPTQFSNQFKAPELSAATQFTNQFKAPDPYQSTAFKSGTFGQEQAQQYMNPYLQSSLNPQLEEARRQSNISEQANKAAMTKAGAFGGGRSAILTAENQRNLGTNLAGITGKGYDTAFQNAMSQFNADQARNLQAQQASEQSKQFGATQGMTAADMMAKYGMSAQQAQEAARQFNQGQSMTAAQQAAQYGQSAQQASEQSRQFGADLGLKGLQTGLQAAQAQGNLGISSGQLGLAQLQEQARLGAQQRGIEAEGIAADKAAFEEARENPYKMVQFQQSLLQGMPITATNYNMAQPSTLQEILAGAGGGAKLAGNTDSGITLDSLLGNLGLGSSSPAESAASSDSGGLGLGLGLAGGLAAAAAARPAEPEPMFTPKQEPSYAYNPPPPEPPPPPPPSPARRGGGSGCPAPWVNILLADGGLVKAGDIQPGMEVYTRHEHTNEWGVFPVSVVRPGTDERWIVKFDDGREFVGTFNHPVMVDGKWVEIKDLQSGDKILQQEGFAVVKSSEYHDHGPIVKIEVKDAHTYISEGFLSHNKQMIEDRERTMDARHFWNEFAKGGLIDLPRRR